MTRTRVHPAWFVAVTAFVALVGAAGFRAAPGALFVPLHDEFGWSTSIMSLAVSINLLLYGLTAPFAAALMDKFGIRKVTTVALLMVSLGSGLTVFMTESFQLLITWGVLIGLGTGSMAMVFAATIANRWFIERRGLVMGILTAGGATGQLVFLPIVAALADNVGWRTASLTIAGAALLVVPLVIRFIGDFPEDRSLAPYGAPADWRPPVRETGGAAKRATDALRAAARVPAFWALAAAFAICGATTNGLVGIHFIPSAHDHGMAQTTAAGLLAVVGIFDIAGTVASGWFTDRYDPRMLLVGYYAFRGVGLVLLPSLLSSSVRPSIVAFVVIYGLDWVATVPPTVALCREIFGEQGTIVFGWVFAAHQFGAAAAALVAGVIRDQTGSYSLAWFGGAGLCAVAAVLSWILGSSRKRAAVRESLTPVPM
ncbi:MFS transporter [Aeromicrobium ginsengisoli]|uniref:MFS transporter n=1 Tax=Aeromicrobium ginsengisoli TaxID=363867 RepID=A0A5M4FAH3_9ACTN|nr:MFS transporter [Aeromicrobium ginsengisoli]KAA1395341.1 MFS transporter [Aeromicrobium ginsengisoli]